MVDLVLYGRETRELQLFRGQLIQVGEYVFRNAIANYAKSVHVRFVLEYTKIIDFLEYFEIVVQKVIERQTWTWCYLFTRFLITCTWQQDILLFT